MLYTTHLPLRIPNRNLIKLSDILEYGQTRRMPPLVYPNMISGLSITWPPLTVPSHSDSSLLT